MVVVAACGFRAPDGGGGPDAADPDAPPDGSTARCDLLPSWEAGLQPTRTVHVSKTAGPGIPDGSQTNPYTTINAAVSSVTAGTRILLGPGDYGGLTILDKRGQPAAPIWLEGPSTGQPARIVGGAGTGLHFIRPQYWVIRNLEVTSLTQQPGINIDDGGLADTAHHVVIDHVRVTSVVRPCMQFSGVNDLMIRDSVAASCERGVMMVGVHRATVARMDIASIVTAGVAVAGGSADIEIRQNVIASAENGLGIWIGGDSGLLQFRPPLSATTGNTEARNIRVFNNVIRDVEEGVMCSNCTASLVAHNLFRRVSAFVFKLHQPYTEIGIYQFASAGGVQLINNAIEVGSSAEAIYEGQNGTDADSLVFSHNLWLKNGATWAPALPTQETMGIYDTPSGYGDDGRLCTTTSSRSAGAGTPLTDVTGTLTGTCRPSPPARPSIGPSEPDPGC